MHTLKLSDVLSAFIVISLAGVVLILSLAFAGLAISRIALARLCARTGGSNGDKGAAKGSPKKSAQGPQA